MPRRVRLYVNGALILLAGLLGATAVYLTAADGDSDAVADEIVDGVAYPVAVHDAKAYRHDLERFGGQAKPP